MSGDAAPAFITPGRFDQALRAVEGTARPLVALHLTDEPADPPGVYTSDDGPLLVPYDVANGLGMDVARTFLQAVVAVPDLAMALARVASLHRPVHRRHTTASGIVVEDVCPDCLGGMFAADPDDPRECGCWGLTPAVCAECAQPTPGGRMVPVRWPCPTWMPLERLADQSARDAVTEFTPPPELESGKIKRLAPMTVSREVLEGPVPGHIT